MFWQFGPKAPEAFHCASASVGNGPVRQLKIKVGLGTAYQRSPFPPDAGLLGGSGYMSWRIDIGIVLYPEVVERAV